MAKCNIEIEVKFPLLNPSVVLEWLSKNAEALYESRQVDEYFNAPHRNFLGGVTVDDWLRIREESNGKRSINYKHWYQSEVASHYCDEFETAIESPDSMRKILGALQFETMIKVDKLRRAFKYKDIEFAIDEVAELGSFIEAEYLGDKTDVTEVNAYLIAAISEVGAEVGPVDVRGYPYWLMERKGLIGGDVSNLKKMLVVFYNIAGRLDEAGIDYMLSGSMSAKFHGLRREAGDLDILIHDRDVPKLLELFSANITRSRHRCKNTFFNEDIIECEVDGVTVEFCIIESGGVHSYLTGEFVPNSKFYTPVAKEIWGRVVKVQSLPSIIAYKDANRRQKALNQRSDVEELRKILDAGGHENFDITEGLGEL